MGLYRDESGRIMEIDDEFADARGYTPVSAAENEDLNAQAGIAARGETGLAGDIRTAAGEAASGLTLGGSDWVLSQALTPLEREQVAAERAARPILSTVSNIAGGVVGALAAPGSLLARTPAGYLGTAAARGIESGLARGGVAGVAGALGAMGAEGAAQSVGQYIGHAALEDKELTAEGLSGALGTGFAFGSIGGGAALGVVKGVMAGRRLYSRVMDGRKAADVAASSWTKASEEALQADSISAQVAETKLGETRKAKIEAQRRLNEARAIAEEERISASGIPEQAAPVGETSVAQTSSVRPEDIAPTAQPTVVLKSPERPTSAASLDDGVAPVADVIPANAPITKKIARPEVVKTPETELESQLAGTKAMLDEGTPLKNIAADMRARRAETVAEVRYNATSDLLSPVIAKEERRLINALDEYKAARADVEQLMRGETPSVEIGGVRTEPTRVGSRGARQAVEILDDAHEEALLRVRNSTDPSAAGQAVSEAEELERMLEQLAEPRLTPGQGLTRSELRAPDAERWMKEMFGDIGKIQRYEKASAELTDALGDQAHPTSVLKAKALRDAERESERKVMDRTARAVDDAETFGPEHMSPKERVKYARERQNEARRDLDELGVQEKEAKLAYGEASKKVRAGEKAKKAALREDAKIAAKAGKLGGQDVGGILEWFDLPGLPKPSDLPVVGPLLGAWLKFRLAKRAMSRLLGKVPATADNRVAALASQTRDRIARAVDHSIGVIERGGKYYTRAAPSAAAILANRLYDDGEPDAKKGASVQTLVATRIRELTAYVHTPGAIENDVRRELRGVADPDTIAAAEQHRRQVMESLLKHAPNMPPPDLLNPVEWEPSPAAAMSFARRLDAANDPAGVFERLAHEQAMLSLEAAEMLRENYPKLFGQAQQRLMERAAENKLKVPYRTRVQLSLLYKVPLDAALDPVNLNITQSVYERKPSSPAYNPQAAPAAQPPNATPAIANPVDISQAFTPSLDRR